MIILLTNDDGFQASGIKTLRNTVKMLYPEAEVWTVAPFSDKSGQSHSVTIDRPLTLTEISDKEFSVDGSPVDCVMLGLNFVIPNRKPDIVISGINAGANIGTDKLYSGTIAAAMESNLRGIPSIAISQAYEGLKGENAIKECFERSTSCTVFHSLLKKIIGLSLSGESIRCTSINLPFLQKVSGVKVKSMGTHSLDFSFEKCDNNRYVIGSLAVKEFPDSDIRSGYITVTPLSPDWTEENMLLNLAQELEKAGIKSNT